MKGGAAPEHVVPYLRALAAIRPLTSHEERSLAEAQANLLLHLHNVAKPPVPLKVIAKLPGMHVEYRHDAPLSGLAIHRRPHHWKIVIAAHEPQVRRRFSLAHEFKHVLDDPVIRFIHEHLTAEQHDRQAERICNYFAACLLMPATWLRRDWEDGKPGVRDLAGRYRVSAQAMGTRLNELGLKYQALPIRDLKEGGIDDE